MLGLPIHHYRLPYHRKHGKQLEQQFCTDYPGIKVSRQRSVRYNGWILECCGQVTFDGTDLSKSDKAKKIIQNAAKFFDGKIDILINNAGIDQFTPIEVIV